MLSFFHEELSQDINMTMFTFQSRYNLFLVTFSLTSVPSGLPGGMFVQFPRGNENLDNKKKIHLAIVVLCRKAIV